MKRSSAMAARDGNRVFDMQANLEFLSHNFFVSFFLQQPIFSPSQRSAWRFVTSIRFKIVVSR
jgi:hypothetical protein